MRPKASLIIRSKNEEKWIGHCLEAVFGQSYQDFEVIIVDNKSTDRTLSIAQNYDVKIKTIDHYLPGRAINIGVEASQGDFIVLLSAHCLPVNKEWLGNLLKDFDNSEVMGIYGRQEPMSFSSDFDKRDLLIAFGLDKKVQYKDSFFHNANSAIRKSILTEVPISDTLTNIEDRAWGKEIIRAGKVLVYEPEASVYHYHGIHQNQNAERCRSVVRILEELNLVPSRLGKTSKKATASSQKIDALVPAKGSPLMIGDRPLLEFTLQRLKESSYIQNIYVLTDDKETASIAQEQGALVPFLRDSSLSQDYVDVETVLLEAIQELEKKGLELNTPLVVYPTNPFRSKNFFNQLIERFFERSGEIDSLVAVTPEFESCWKEGQAEIDRLDQGLIPRKFKDPLLLGIQGLGCITSLQNIKEKNIVGTSTGLLPLDEPMARMEIRDHRGVELLGDLLALWWEKEK